MLSELDKATAIELALILCGDQVFEGDFPSLSLSLTSELRSLGYEIVKKEPTDVE